MTWSSLIRSRRWLISPHLSAWQMPLIKTLQSRVPAVPDVIWLLSSGTQSVRSVKAIGLSHEAILASSAAVNRHLKSTAQDHWLRPIPHYHIGGLSIYARAHLSGAAVSEWSGPWDPQRLSQQLEDESITLTSLVPTQIFDLVQAELRAPPKLRAAIVGGGALDPALYLEARALGWPLLPSYGLTECCSQVATAPLESLNRQTYPGFKVLDHVRVKLVEQRIYLSSPSLSLGLATAREDGTYTFESPVRHGWFATEDLARLDGDTLTILGRRDDVVKILGTLVALPEVEQEVRAVLKLTAPFCVLALKDARDEHRLVLVTSDPNSVKTLAQKISAYNETALGPKRLKGCFWVKALPQGELGKIKKAELLRLLNLK